MTGFQDATTTSYYLTAVPNGTLIPITMPPVVAAGDFLFMFHSSAHTMTAPAGWTAITTGLGRDWWRLADGTEGGTTKNWTAAGSGAGTADYKAHAVVVRYSFALAFTTPVGNSDTWAFGNTSSFGTLTAHKSFTENPPAGGFPYELRLYVITNTFANENYIDPILGQVGAPRPAGPVSWTNATQVYSDEASGTLGTVPNVPSGTTPRCDLITVAERYVDPGVSPGSQVDVTLSPDGGQVGDGFRVRLAFSASPAALFPYWGILATPG